MDMKTIMAAARLANRQGGGSSESISEAVNAALEDAKASGAFKGDKGDKGDTGAAGAKGETGAKGADGVSPTVTVSKSGKVTTLTIKDASGTKTAAINDGADGAAGAKGEKGDTGATGAKGADGKTPVKGTDYWTEADKQEIIDAVIAAIKAEEAAG